MATKRPDSTTLEEAVFASESPPFGNMITIAVVMLTVLFCCCFVLCYLFCYFFINRPDTDISQTSHRESLIEIDSFLTDIKKNFFINADCQEMRDIKYAVEKNLRKICKKLNFPYKIKKTILGGSVAENTRLWNFTIKPFVFKINEPFVEFDFLAVMHMNDIRIGKLCDGYMGVTEKNTKHVYSLRYFIDATDFLSLFVSNMDKIIRSNALQDISTPSGNLSLDRSFRFTIMFNWKSKVQQIRPPDINEQKWKTFGVHVDFLPAIEFKHGDVIPTDADKGWAEARDFDCSRFLVPKTCPYDHNCCWKVSTMLEEQQMIKKASRVHLEAYMFLKFFLTFAEEPNFVTATSYMMKTVFLYHLGDNKCPPSGESVRGCLSALLKSMSTMLENSDIPHYFFKYNLFFSAMTSRTYRFVGAGHRVACIDSILDTFENQYTLRYLLEEMTKLIKAAPPSSGYL